MKGISVLILAAASLALANAKSYTVSLFNNTTVSGTELKAGDYRLEVNDQKAVITKGKVRAEATVNVQNSDVKYETTSVVLSGGEGKSHILEVHLGGTKTKLVFAE